MNTKFDEFTKSPAQSVTRRAALKKFGIGLAGMALACFGLANKAHAGKIEFCMPAGATCIKGGWPCCHGHCHDIGSYGPGTGICKGERKRNQQTNRIP